MDRRIKYTKSAIKEAFLSLLEYKELNKITVSELCQLADVNRATFYRYYLDIYDLFDKIQEEFVDELKLAINNDDSSKYTVATFSHGLLEVLLKEKKLAKIMFKTNNKLLFLDDILEITYDICYNNWKADLPDVDPQDVEYATIFIFNGALGIINYWITNNFEKDVNEIAQLIENLSYRGIRELIYKK